jgi:hypothetical protein
MPVYSIRFRRVHVPCYFLQNFTPSLFAKLLDDQRANTAVNLAVLLKYN